VFSVFLNLCSDLYCFLSFTSYGFTLLSFSNSSITIVLVCNFTFSTGFKIQVHKNYKYVIRQVIYSGEGVECVNKDVMGVAAVYSYGS
jgi:hypothetical protein